MDDHAGGVEHPAQRRLLGAREALARAGDEVGLVVRARPQLRAPLVDHRARRGDGQRVRRVERGGQAVDRGEVAQAHQTEVSSATHCDRSGSAIPRSMTALLIVVSSQMSTNTSRHFVPRTAWRLLTDADRIIGWIAP